MIKKILNLIIFKILRIAALISRNKSQRPIETAVEEIKESPTPLGQETTVVNMREDFPLFYPYSAGSYDTKAHLAIESIKQIFFDLLSLSKVLELKEVKVQKISDLLISDDQHRNADELKALFDSNGSDKAEAHNYFLFYSQLFKDRKEVRRVFEIGLGTNNTQIISNMGANGKPGASLRAFRDFLPNAIIYGADVDRDILFKEDRIETYWIDQLDRTSFNEIKSIIPDNFDLMVDDGLHSPAANIHSLEFFLPKLRIGGWAIIEDIGHHALPLWELIGAFLPDKYEAIILNGTVHSLFCVKRLS
jgi:hypothetical protein